MAGYLGDVPTATEALGDAAPDVRAAALGALARLEALTAEHLTLALADPDRNVVRRGDRVVSRRARGGAPAARRTA